MTNTLNKVKNEDQQQQHPTRDPMKINVCFGVPSCQLFLKPFISNLLSYVLNLFCLTEISLSTFKYKNNFYVKKEFKPSLTRHDPPAKAMFLPLREQLPPAWFAPGPAWFLGQRAPKAPLTGPAGVSPLLIPALRTPLPWRLSNIFLKIPRMIFFLWMWMTSYPQFPSISLIIIIFYFPLEPLSALPGHGNSSLEHSISPLLTSHLKVTSDIYWMIIMC